MEFKEWYHNEVPLYVKDIISDMGLETFFWLCWHAAQFEIISTIYKEEKKDEEILEKRPKN